MDNALHILLSIVYALYFRFILGIKHVLPYLSNFTDYLINIANQFLTMASGYSSYKNEWNAVRGNIAAC